MKYKLNNKTTPWTMEEIERQDNQEGIKMKTVYVHPFIDQNAKGFWVDYAESRQGVVKHRQLCLKSRLEAIEFISTLELRIKEQGQ